MLINEHTCHVTSHQQCGHDLYLLALLPDKPLQIAAGQFVMVSMPGDRFLFRRPFSVLSQHPQTGEITLFYKKVGLGTALMTQWMLGDTVQILAPLGKGFLPVTQPTLLIGGGIGIAPLYCVGQHNPLATCVYGVRSEGDLGIMPQLQDAFAADKLFITTDDGSYGFKGHVGHWLSANPAAATMATRAYICGPTPMMQAVAQQLNQLNPDMSIYVSMEEHMPCGIGACTGCVVPRVNDQLPVKTCIDGPVFNANEIDWHGHCWQPAAAGCEKGALT
jgi:dihydroorotate dehydrogenase electron transfer subunit